VPKEFVVVRAISTQYFSAKQSETIIGGVFMSEQKAQSNVVFVGKKPAMSYVLACVTQFNDGNDEVILKARGRAISHAVDVAEIVRNKFVKDVQVKNVSIGTEEVQTEQGEKLNVSSIEIVIGK
jgi:DNA-binding protein